MIQNNKTQSKFPRKAFKGKMSSSGFNAIQTLFFLLLFFFGTLSGLCISSQFFFSLLSTVHPSTLTQHTHNNIVQRKRSTYTYTLRIKIPHALRWVTSGTWLKWCCVSLHMGQSINTPHLKGNLLIFFCTLDNFHSDFLLNFCFFELRITFRWGVFMDCPV